MTTLTIPPAFNPTETYALTATTGIIRGSDGAHIPADPNNSDYRAFLAWQASGKVATPYVAPPAPVPSVVSRRQFFQAAAQEGIITQAEALALLATGVIPAELQMAINALPAAEQFPAQLAIIGDPTFERANPLVAALSAAMNQTSAQIDAMFTLAATL